MRLKRIFDVNCVQKQATWITASADSRHQWRH